MSVRKTYASAFLLSIGSFLLFSVFSAQGISGGDSGDLVTAAYLGGIPHPPGYPFYTFLGWLFSKIPWFTVSWRVGLLSGIPHSLVIGLIFLIIYRLTKQWVPALFGALALLVNYLFFLYSVTPEVFGLLDFFIIFLVYLFIGWSETKKKIYLYAAGFTFGLSLTHHQLVLFLLPACCLLCISSVKETGVKIGRKTIIMFFACFAAGLLPFIYIPLAARGQSIINWDLAENTSGFIRLITRADYGTFQSGGFYATRLISRILQVKAYLELIFNDFTPAGIIIVTAGFWWAYSHSRKIFNFLAVALISVGPAFLFYASFPLFNRFNIGTYERFLLPTYVLLYITQGLGFWQIIRVADGFLHKRFSVWRQIGKPAFCMLLFLYPVTFGAVTFLKFSPLPGDRTADNLGIDILTSLPKGSILLLSRDTPLFTTQYVRYALGVRSDVAVLHAGPFASDWYPPIIKRNFPGLSLPVDRGNDFAPAFIRENRGKSPVFTNFLFAPDKGWFWVPFGLVYRLEEESKLPPIEDFYTRNTILWSRFHDPSKGILSRYNHLMLSDIRDVYAAARIEFGRTLLKAGKYREAKVEFAKALDYGGDTQIADEYTLLGLADLFLGQCRSALLYFQKARAASPAPDKALSLYEGATYRDCEHNAARAKEFFDEYEKMRQKEETPLR